MSLLPFFDWCYATPIGETIRNSTWLFPVIEAFHLLALALVAGAVLIVDFRLLGVGVKRAPVAQLAADAQPWLIGGVILMAATGIPLFLSESIKCYYSFAFWVKMTCLLLVLILTFTLRRRVIQASGMAGHLTQHATVVAAVSLILWFGVAWGGRWIGFSLKHPPIFYDALRCCRLDGLSLGHSAVIQRTMHAIGVGSLALVLFGLCPAASSAPQSTITDVAPAEVPSAPAPSQPALAASEALNVQVRAVVEAAEAAAKEADRKAGEARRWQASAQTSAAKAREAAQKAEAKAAGYGVLTGTGSGEDKATWRYAGQVRARKENGFGVEAWSSGERNEGEFLNDEENGAMVSVYPAGTRYEGEFRNAKRSGAGVYTWTDGDHYEGEFSNASRNGYGTYYGAETKAFTAKSGQWVNGRLTGHAVILWKDGKRSAGSFQNDQLDGYGALFDAEGHVIEQGYYEFGELKSPLH